jgi:hypothetical protein
VLEINGASGTVIGVTPPEFFGETVGAVPDVWLPISFQPQFMPADWLNAPSHSWLTMMGRLRPGISARQAVNALDLLYGRLAALTAQSPKREYRVQLQSASRGIDVLEQRFGRPLWVLADHRLVLLIAQQPRQPDARPCHRAHAGNRRPPRLGGPLPHARQLLTEGLVLIWAPRSHSASREWRALAGRLGLGRC